MKKKKKIIAGVTFKIFFYITCTLKKGALCKTAKIKLKSEHVLFFWPIR